MPEPLHLRAPALADAEADIAACAAALKAGSYTFHAASLLLPARVRGPACALYAFCRRADDLVDGGADAHAAVQTLQAQLDRVYDGTHEGPALASGDRALAAVVAHYGVPRELLAALLDGFLWDAQARRYETLEDLQDYAARVAGSVGAMMALLMGVRDADAIARACDLGVAMQLSNIARDVGEDARAGRLYLPLAWLREAGIAPEAWLARPAFEPAIASCVKRLLACADNFYARAAAGVGSLPLDCRPGINAARLVYAAIGHQVVRNGLDSISQRAVVPRWRKAGLLLQALLALWPAAAGRRLPCLPANRFLVNAAARPSAGSAPAPAWWQLGRRADARAARLLDMFERMGQRERPVPWPGKLS